jgi:hypothetical protein
MIAGDNQFLVRVRRNVARLQAVVRDLPGSEEAKEAADLLAGAGQ